VRIVFRRQDGTCRWVRCLGSELQEAINLGPSTVEIVDGTVEEISLPPSTTGTDLRCLTPNLRAIDGFHGWPNLTCLILSSTKVSSLATIAGHARLRSLELDGLTLRDLSPLLYIRRLGELSVQGSTVYGWGTLSQLRLLHTLNASWSNLNSLSEISQPFLQTVYAAGSRICDLDNLGDQVNIQELSLSACEMKSLAGVEKMPCLRDLWMREALCDDFTAIVGALSLVSLEVAGSSFRDVSFLKECLSLYNVSVRGCSVEGWESLIGSRGMRFETPRGSMSRATRRLLEASGHTVWERKYPNRSDGSRTRVGW